MQLSSSTVQIISCKQMGTVNGAYTLMAEHKIYITNALIR